MPKLTGNVIDHITHVPIAEATLMLQKKDGPSTDIAQITNDEGEFRWNSLNPGDYELHVFCDGYEGQVVAFEIDEADPLEITIALHKK